MPSLFVLHPLLTGVIFPCRYPYVSTRDCRGDLRGAVRHRARGYRGFCFDYLTRQGGELVSLLCNFLLMPSCSTRMLLFDPIHPICHVLNPYNHVPHNPAKHCTARLPLLGHCLVWIENLLITLLYYGWDNMLNKKL